MGWFNSGWTIWYLLFWLVWFLLLKAVVERKAQDLCSSWGLRAYRHVAPELSIFDREEHIFTSHWPASTALALGILGRTDNVITMGAERMIPTLVKGVAVFPAVPVLLGPPWKPSSVATLEMWLFVLTKCFPNHYSSKIHAFGANSWTFWRKKSCFSQCLASYIWISSPPSDF